MKVFWIVAFLGPCWAVGQEEHSLLWSVTKDGSSHKSYLFGSMHTADSTANTFSESWWMAFNQCSIVASEVSINDNLDAATVMENAFMKDTLLQDLYSSADYKIVQSFLESELDTFYVSFMEHVKPFHTLALIMEMPDNGEPIQSVMDVRIQMLAQSKEKKILGLETASEQAASIDILTLHEQADLLLQYAKNESEVEGEFESLKGYYLEQNLDSLSELGAGAYFPEKLILELVQNRNERFFNRLKPAIEVSNVFCMVGAMHLPGENGLIAMLRKEGYKVEPVIFYFGNKK